MATSCARPAAPEPAALGVVAPATVLRHVRVFDGHSVIERTTVVLKDGTIAAVAADAPEPAQASVIAGEGLTVLPGFIDAHTHTWAPQQLRQALMLGVTTELDMMSEPARSRWLKDRIAEGQLWALADLRSAGNPVTPPGGHGTEYGLKYAVLADSGQARAFVASRVAEGSDYIKIVQDSGASWGASFAVLGPDTLREAIAAAHSARRLAIVHAGTLAEARAAVDAKADGLAHLWFGGPDVALARSLREQDAFVVPTLSLLLTGCGSGSGDSLLGDPRVAPYVSHEERLLLRYRGWAQHLDWSCAPLWSTFRSLQRHRVTLLVGSDAGNPGASHGVTVHAELGLFVAGGMTELAALASATSVPARVFGLADRGRVAPGLRADLVLVRGDPTSDIDATRNIVAVYQRGVRVDRESYRDQLAREAPAPRPVIPAPPRLVGDFEAEERGFLDPGWAVSTDGTYGGGSSVALRPVPGGAAVPGRALGLEGTVAESNYPFPWAGVLYSPGTAPMQPVDLSSFREIVFWARGDGGEYQLMLFIGGRAIMAWQDFVAEPEWREHRFPFHAFDRADGQDIAGILFSARRTGRFAFDLDRVELR